VILDEALLKVLSFLHDLLEDAAERIAVERSLVGLQGVLQDLLFAAGLLYGQAVLLFQLADLGNAARTLIEEANQLAVEVVDFFAPVSYIHHVSKKAD
jgi:hypothetical protein